MSRRGLIACALAALAGCASPRPPEPRGWIDLDSTSRAERLFGEAHLQPRALRLEDAQLRFIELGPADRKASREVPWLFIHGLGGNLADFAPLMLEAAREHRVFAVDLPGFGGSVSLTPDYSIPRFVRTLRQFAAAVEVPRFHFVCHSLGGQVCLGLSLDAPSLVGSMTLVDSAGSYDQKEFLERMSRGRMGRIRPERDPSVSGAVRGSSDLLQRLLGNEPSVLAALSSFQVNYHNRIRDVGVPTLIVWGADDVIFPVEYAFFLKENIAGSTLRVAQGAGHAPQLSSPALVLDWIERFHAGLGPRREP